MNRRAALKVLGAFGIAGAGTTAAVADTASADSGDGYDFPADAPAVTFASTAGDGLRIVEREAKTFEDGALRCSFTVDTRRLDPPTRRRLVLDGEARASGFVASEQNAVGVPVTRETRRADASISFPPADRDPDSERPNWYRAVAVAVNGVRT